MDLSIVVILGIIILVLIAIFGLLVKYYIRQREDIEMTSTRMRRLLEHSHPEGEPNIVQFPTPESIDQSKSSCP